MMSKSNRPAPSLRERNRTATRYAIADAALHLATRDGLDAIRNEDIAKLAGVSPRTFSNYFANKYEALSFRHVERMRYAAEALRNRPASEPLWEAIRAAVLAPWTEPARDGERKTPGTIAELRMLFSSRSVQAEIMTDAVSADNAFAHAVAERLGLNPAQDIYPRLIAAAATSVTQVAIDAFLQSNPPVDPLPLIANALAQLAEGLPEPGKAAGAKTPASPRKPTSRGA